MQEIYHFLPFLSNRFHKKAIFCEILRIKRACTFSSPLERDDNKQKFCRGSRGVVFQKNPPGRRRQKFRNLIKRTWHFFFSFSRILLEALEKSQKLVYINISGTKMRRNRRQSVMIGTARLLDIGSTQNRRKIKKTIAEEVHEIFKNSNRMVLSVLYMNINKNVEGFLNTKTSRGVDKRLKTIESRIASLEKKIKKYKDEAAYQMERL